MNIIMPTYEDTMRYGRFNRGFNRTASGMTPDQMFDRAKSQLCGSITRGIGYRNLAGRMAMFSGGTSIPDWWTPLLTASWPNQTAFDEYPQDTANYNDIYATY